MGVNSGPNSVIEGLIFAIDAGNLSSYSGTGTSVVEISRISASTSLQSGVIYYNTSPKGYFQFDGINDNIPVTLTNVGTTTTIEIWMKMKAFVNGMPFGFNNYTIWTGGGGGGTLGFNTAGGDSHGLTSTQVTNLGLLNQWKHFQSVIVCFSIDGMDDMANYIRYPSKWEVIKQLKKHYKHS
jgi:hypothetical protein